MKSRSHVHAVVFAIALVTSAGAIHAAAEQKDKREEGERPEDVVTAGELLAGQVKNLADPVGQVNDIILNNAKDEVEYVIFRLHAPWNNGKEGYLDFDSLKIGHSTDGRVILQIRNPEVGHPPEKLKLSRDQQERVVSYLLGRKIEFEDGEEREIEDLLIDPTTGKLTHYVVRIDSVSKLFGQERRAIHAKNVSISQAGRIKTGLTLADVEKQQDYDPGILG